MDISPENLLEEQKCCVSQLPPLSRCLCLPMTVLLYTFVGISHWHKIILCKFTFPWINARAGKPRWHLVDLSQSVMTPIICLTNWMFWPTIWWSTGRKPPLSLMGRVLGGGAQLTQAPGCFVRNKTDGSASNSAGRSMAMMLLVGCDVISQVLQAGKNYAPWPQERSLIKGGASLR